MLKYKIINYNNANISKMPPSPKVGEGTPSNTKNSARKKTTGSHPQYRSADKSHPQDRSAFPWPSLGEGMNPQNLGCAQLKPAANG
jgi:hypothetical protein